MSASISGSDEKLMPDRKLFTSERLAAIPPFRVMALLASARRMQAEGRDIIHLEVGEPDFPTPEPVKHAAKHAIDYSPGGYTPAAGLPVLREAISAYYQREFSLSIPGQRILVTTGASSALLALSALLVEPGHGVLLTDPGYPCNRQFVEMMGGEAQLLPLSHASAYRPDTAALANAWQDNTRGVLLASPANPTGAALSLAELQAISRFTDEKSAYFIVDELYQELVYDHEPVSVLQSSDEVFVVNSFSKYFGMTGWRLGWMVVPEIYTEPLDRFLQNFYLAPPTVSQYAAVAALGEETRPELERRRQVLGERRDYLVNALRQLGFDIPVMPDGAFYIYAGIGRFSDDAVTFCQDLLQETGVAITPGIDFSIFAASDKVRFAYTCDLARLEEAVNRIARFLQH